MKTRMTIGIIFLLIQVFFIIHARFSEARYFCWAPHDAQNEFELTVFMDGRELIDAEIFQRYRLPKKGRDPRSIEHIKLSLKQYEETYGKDNPARITMNYTVNGVKYKPWVWPPTQ